MLSCKCVLLADRVTTHDEASLKKFDLEKLSDMYFNDVSYALNSIFPQVIHYQSPVDFINNISAHKKDVVLSLWSGERSRNRRALVPSICEAYHIPYIGADRYVQIICADKHLSKSICVKHGLNVANDIIIQDKYDLVLLHTLNYPVVIKPNYEGGSIGILRENLADTFDAASSVVLKLLQYYPQVIVEEYIPGFEVSVCVAGTQEHIDVFQVVQTIVNGKKYFDHDILCAEDKKVYSHSKSREIVTELLPSAEKEKIIKLFLDLGKVDMMRVDGRINKSGFTIIELTPDCSLSRHGSMAISFLQEGYGYSEMYKLLCKNCLNNYNNGISKCQYVIKDTK